MSQSELERLVASSTGESLLEIRRRGFSLANPIDVDFDPEPTAGPQMVDWDELDAGRPSLFP